jgi:hypothetical protein
MAKGLFRKKEKAALVAIDRQLQELLQLAPEIRDFLQMRNVLDALGPHIATLDALGPHIATLDALGPRLAIIDRTSFALTNLDNFAHEITSIANVAVFTDLVQQLRPIVDTYLNQNHLVAENVRVDVETVTVLMTALQMQINSLQKTISDSHP